MFKMQSKLQSMDVNKNTEKYKFHPGHRAFTNTKKKINKTFDKNPFTESQKYSIRDKLLNQKDIIPPVYFYRKVNTPYKYNMTSVPEYLIKTNEEKNFINKLFKSLNDDTEKNILENLINKKKLKSTKDYFKPPVLEVQNVLHYKPKLYKNSFIPNINMTETSIKNEPNFLINENKKPLNNNEDNTINKSIMNDYFSLDKSVKKNESANKDEKMNNYCNNDKTENNRINEEISKDERIKYKYKLSDVFNLRKDPLFYNKSAEKYLFKPDNRKYNFINTCPNMNYVKENENNFYTSSESKSDWIPNKLNNKKMGTHSSVAYNILSPMFQGSNKFITARELNKDNLYNECPAFHRVKSISEFIDLTRVSATNTLECFNRNVNKKIPDFKFKGSVATNQSDEYYINRNLIEKPI